MWSWPSLVPIPPQCYGPSMEPTLYTNDVLLTERISKRFNGLKHNDIVVCKNPTNPDQYICKRVIGLPGDRVSMKPRVSFNPFANTKSTVTTDVEERPSESQIHSGEMNDIDKSSHLNNMDMSMATFQSKDICVPKGMVWLEGDNSENSRDSRLHGPVPMGLIQSRIVCKVWPLNQIQLFIWIYGFTTFIHIYWEFG